MRSFGRLSASGDIPWRGKAQGGIRRSVSVKYPSVPGGLLTVREALKKGAYRFGVA
jgi:hypothetical protein